MKETVTRRTPKVRVKRAAKKKARAAPAPSADEGDDVGSPSPSVEKTTEVTPVRRGVKRTVVWSSEAPSVSSSKASHPSEAHDDDDNQAPPLTQSSPTLRQSLSRSRTSSPSKKKTNKTDKSSSSSSTIFVATYDLLGDLDTAGTGEVQVREASSEKTPAKQDEAGDTSSSEDEAAATPSNDTPPLGDSWHTKA